MKKKHGKPQRNLVAKNAHKFNKSTAQPSKKTKQKHGKPKHVPLED